MGVSHNGKVRSQIRFRKAPSVKQVLVLINDLHLWNTEKGTRIHFTCHIIWDIQFTHYRSCFIINKSFRLFLLSIEAFTFLFCVHSHLFGFFFCPTTLALPWTGGPECTHRNKPMRCFSHVWLRSKGWKHLPLIFSDVTLISDIKPARPSIRIVFSWPVSYDYHNLLGLSSPSTHSIYILLSSR